MTITRPAIFASAFWPSVGGVEELVSRLAGEQQARGMSPVVVTHRHPANLRSTELHENVPVHRIRFSFPEPRPRHLAGLLGHGLKARHQVTALLKDHRADLVHVQCVSNNGLYALGAASRLRLPLVVTMQGELTMDAGAVYQRSAVLRAVWRRLLDKANVITACSAFVLAEAEAAYGRPFGARGHVVHNGVALTGSSAAPASDLRPYILGVGRMVPQKGFDLLIDAYERLRPTPDLVLVGDGIERAALQARAHRAGLSDRIHFPGALPHEEVVRWFAGAELFVLPSRHEPQGIVILEAMASGAPVLAADVGGVAEIVVDGENGLLFKGSDIDHLVERMRQSLNDGFTASARVRAGKATGAMFTWQRVTDRYDECYAQALGAASAR